MRESSLIRQVKPELSRWRFMDDILTLTKETENERTFV